MKVNVCDRCGFRTTFHSVYIGFSGSNKDEVHEEFELCADCAAKLWSWLHNAPKEAKT